MRIKTHIGHPQTCTTKLSPHKVSLEHQLGMMLGKLEGRGRPSLHRARAGVLCEAV